MSEETIVEAKEKKPKSKGITFLLWLFFGIFGAHKFYLGRIKMGIVYLLTLGFFVVGWFFDIFTLFRQVDVANGLRSKDEAGLLAGFGNMLKVSRGLQSVAGSVGGGYTCIHCGKNVIPGAHSRCSRSLDGMHHS